MVSIIVPHYNRPVLLKNMVNSVLNQSSNDWELIIVDDRSGEKDFEAISRLPLTDSRISVQSRKSLQKGPSACRNEGVAIAKGEYIIFLDSDDALASFCIEQRQRAMDENRDLSMGIFLMQEFINVAGDSEKIYNNKSNHENRINCFLEGDNPWAVTCPIWRKHFFLQTGGFDESFFYMEDPDLHVRALLQEGMLYKTFYDCPADCFYRVNFHDDTKKNFYENSIHYRIEFYKKTGSIISGESNLRKRYKSSFEKGVLNFFTHLLLYRVKEFPALQKEFTQWVATTGLISGLTLLKFRILTAIFKSDNILYRKIHLKGFASKLLMAKM